MSVLADMSPTLYPAGTFCTFVALLLYIYFWPRLWRARLGSGVVYVTGQIGLPNSERLTLSNVHTGRQLTWGGSGGGGGCLWKSSWSIRFNTDPCPQWNGIDLYSHGHSNTYLTTSPDAILAFSTEWWPLQHENKVEFLRSDN